MNFNIQLALWRNFVETSAAGIALYVYNAQSVARSLTYTFETG